MAKEESGWEEQCLHDRKRRIKEQAAMERLSRLLEGFVNQEVQLPLLALAFHHVAMAHGAYAGKKTLKQACRSSIEELSTVAPEIFPPTRVPRSLKAKKRPKNG